MPPAIGLPAGRLIIIIEGGVIHGPPGLSDGRAA
jgi:hypothetical protein